MRIAYEILATMLFVLLMGMAIDACMGQIFETAEMTDGR